jgi:hypothetical protein
LKSAVDVNAPPEAMWRVISDLGSIQRYASTLQSSMTASCALQPGNNILRERRRWAI